MQQNCRTDQITDKEMFCWSHADFCSRGLLQVDRVGLRQSSAPSSDRDPFDTGQTAALTLNQMSMKVSCLFVFFLIKVILVPEVVGYVDRTELLLCSVLVEVLDQQSAQFEHYDESLQLETKPETLKSFLYTFFIFIFYFYVSANQNKAVFPPPEPEPEGIIYFLELLSTVLGKIKSSIL